MGVAGAVGTSFSVFAGITNVPIFLAFVASDWFTKIFMNIDNVACYVNSFTKEVISSFGGRTDYLDRGNTLVW